MVSLRLVPCIGLLEDPLTDDDSWHVRMAARPMGWLLQDCGSICFGCEVEKYRGTWS